MIAPIDNIEFLRDSDCDNAFDYWDWFVTVDQSRLEIATELYQRMRDYPDTTMVLRTYKNSEPAGLAIAFVESNGRLFFWQGRSIGLTSRQVDATIEVVYDWARKMGVTQVATVPNRAKKVWVRRWGFKETPGSDELTKEI